MSAIPEEYSLLVKPRKLERKNMYTIHIQIQSLVFFCFQKVLFINKKYTLALSDVVINYSRVGKSQSIKNN